MSLFNAMGFNTSHAEGISAAQELRIDATPVVDEAGEDTGVTKPRLFYRDDCTVEGWYPRPVLPTRILSHTWSDYFKPSNPGAGLPVSVFSLMLYCV